MCSLIMILDCSDACVVAFFPLWSPGKNPSFFSTLSRTQITFWPISRVARKNALQTSTFFFYLLEERNGELCVDTWNLLLFCLSA